MIHERSSICRVTRPRIQVQGDSSAVAYPLNPWYSYTEILHWSTALSGYSENINYSKHQPYCFLVEVVERRERDMA